MSKDGQAYRRAQVCKAKNEIRQALDKLRVEKQQANFKQVGDAEQGWTTESFFAAVVRKQEKQKLKRLEKAHDEYLNDSSSGLAYAAVNMLPSRKKVMHWTIIAFLLVSLFFFGWLIYFLWHVVGLFHHRPI